MWLMTLLQSSTWRKVSSNRGIWPPLLWAGRWRPGRRFCIILTVRNRIRKTGLNQINEQKVHPRRFNSYPNIPLIMWLYSICKLQLSVINSHLNASGCNFLNIYNFSVCLFLKIETRFAGSSSTARIREKKVGDPDPARQFGSVPSDSNYCMDNCARCPSDSELSPLARRFFPFPRFPVPKEPKVNSR